MTVPTLSERRPARTRAPAPAHPLEPAHSHARRLLCDPSSPACADVPTHSADRRAARRRSAGRPVEVRGARCLASLRQAAGARFRADRARARGGGEGLADRAAPQAARGRGARRVGSARARLDTRRHPCYWCVTPRSAVTVLAISVLSTVLMYSRRFVESESQHSRLIIHRMWIVVLVAPSGLRCSIRVTVRVRVEYTPSVIPTVYIPYRVRYAIEERDAVAHSALPRRLAPHSPRSGRRYYRLPVRVYSSA